MAQVNEELLRSIIRDVIAETQKVDKPISFNDAGQSATATAEAPQETKPGAEAEKHVDWFKHVGVAKQGYSRDEVIVAVAPAFAEVLDHNLTGISHKEI